MNILKSKTHIGQPISVLGHHTSPSSNRMTVVQPGSTVEAFVAQGSTVQPIRRLIVLVPNVDMDEVQFAREVWEMAVAPRLAVFLFSLCNDTSDELQMERRLINLAALVRDPRITVETHVEFGRDWLRGVKSVLDDGDVILCHEEQSVGLRQKPLVNVLSAAHVPVWTLSGLYPTDLIAHPRWLLNVAFWLGAMAILAGFYYLQTQINDLPGDFAKNIVLCMSVLVELGSLYAWNSIFA